MNPKLWARVAHMVDDKAADQRPAYYDLIKFAVQKEAEINFDEAKKTRDLTSKPKATTHFRFNHNKSGLIATPVVPIVAPAPEEGSGEGGATPPLSEESDSGKSYKAVQEDTAISQGDVEIAVQVAQASEAFRGQCYRCNKVGHRFHDEECEMFDPSVFKHLPGTCEDKQGLAGPWSKGPVQINGGKGDSLGAAPSNQAK